VTAPRSVIEPVVFVASLALTLSVAAVVSTQPAAGGEDPPARDVVVFDPGDPVLVSFSIDPGSIPVPEKQDPIEAFRDRDESLSPVELVELLELVGFPDVRTAWAVAMKESTGDPLARNGNRGTGDSSYGLFQINMIDSLGVARRGQFGLATDDELFDPVRNAEIAFELSRGGTDFGPWGIGPNAYRGSRLGSYPRWYRDFPGGVADE